MSNPNYKKNDTHDEPNYLEFRDCEIFGKEGADWTKAFGGIIHVEEFNTQTLNVLLHLGFDIEFKHDSMLEFLNNHREFYGFGFVIDPAREDSAVVVEGIIRRWQKDASHEEIVEFYRLFNDADEFDLSMLRAWWD